MDIIATDPAARSTSPPGNIPAISVAGVSKRFAGARGETVEALRDVSLNVAEHSIVALLGASGSGKSTLLNIISGILRPDSGRVYLCGTASEEFSDWHAVGYVFQDDRLLPWRTAARNVEFALEARDVPREERQGRAHEALRLVELEGFDEAFPYQLSGGMRSRVALARSLVTEPRILLMDEPFSRLDAQTRALMHEEVLRIHAMKRITIVFVTHDVEEAVVLADQVAVLTRRPGTVREVADIPCARPRDATQPDAIEHIRRLRALI